MNGYSMHAPWVKYGTKSEENLRNFFNCVYLRKSQRLSGRLFVGSIYFTCFWEKINNKEIHSCLSRRRRDVPLEVFSSLNILFFTEDENGLCLLEWILFFGKYTTRYPYTSHIYQSSTIHKTQGLLSDAPGSDNDGYVFSVCLCRSVRTRL